MRLTTNFVYKLSEFLGDNQKLLVQYMLSKQFSQALRLKY